MNTSNYATSALVAAVGAPRPEEVERIVRLLRRHPGARIERRVRRDGTVEERVVRTPTPPRPPARGASTTTPTTRQEAPASVAYRWVADSEVEWLLRRTAQETLRRLARREGLDAADVEIRWFRRARPGERVDFRQKPVLGIYRYRDDVIGLSADELRTSADVESTVAHEWAHALGFDEDGARREGPRLLDRARQKIWADWGWNKAWRPGPLTAEEAAQLAHIRRLWNAR